MRNLKLKQIIRSRIQRAFFSELGSSSMRKCGPGFTRPYTDGKKKKKLISKLFFFLESTTYCNLLFLLIVLKNILYVSVSCLHIYLCTACMPSAHTDQKRVSAALKLEFQMGESPCGLLKLNPSLLGGDSQCSQLLSHLFNPVIYLSLFFFGSMWVILLGEMKTSIKKNKKTKKL